MALARHELRERGIDELDSTYKKPDGEDVGLVFVNNAEIGNKRPGRLQKKDLWVGSTLLCRSQPIAYRIPPLPTYRPHPLLLITTTARQRTYPQVQRSTAATHVRVQRDGGIDHVRRVGWGERSWTPRTYKITGSREGDVDDNGYDTHGKFGTSLRLKAGSHICIFLLLGPLTPFHFPCGGQVGEAVGPVC